MYEADWERAKEGLAYFDLHPEAESGTETETEVDADDDDDESEDESEDDEEDADAIPKEIIPRNPHHHTPSNSSISHIRISSLVKVLTSEFSKE